MVIHIPPKKILLSRVFFAMKDLKREKYARKRKDAKIFALFWMFRMVFALNNAEVCNKVVPKTLLQQVKVI